jgi:hypothetical protein
VNVLLKIGNKMGLQKSWKKCVRRCFLWSSEVIQNDENVRYIGQGEAPHRKYKRLKLGGGHVYDSLSD